MPENDAHRLDRMAPAVGGRRRFRSRGESGDTAREKTHLDARPDTDCTEEGEGCARNALQVASGEHCRKSDDAQNERSAQQSGVAVHRSTDQPRDDAGCTPPYRDGEQERPAQQGPVDHPVRAGLRESPARQRRAMPSS